MKTFGLIGASGFVASRHMKAIHETNNELGTAYDPNDSAGVLDQYFPKTSFFVEYERFERHLDKLRRKGEKIIVLTDCEKATREQLVQYFKREELSELMIPREVRCIKEIPVLTSGKVDYVTIRDTFFSINNTELLDNQGQHVETI